MGGAKVKFAANIAQPNGAASILRLSMLGGLTQFGAYVDTLAPGARSSERHWHDCGDEMVLILSGEVGLIEDSETPMHPGDVACWPAGTPVGHCLENRSAPEARYLVIVTRKRTDIIHYPDHDLITHKDGATRRYLHRDGLPYPDRSET